MVRTYVKGFLSVLSVVGFAAVIGCSSSSDSNASNDAAPDSTDVLEASTDDVATNDVASDVSDNDTQPDGSDDVSVDTDPDTASEGGGSSELTTGVSECFGFASAEERPADYCKAEVVTAKYDGEIGQLVVQNSRVKSNCCGIRKINGKVEAGQITIEEEDTPPDTGRCRCECVVDYRFVTKGIVPGNYTIVVKRKVTEDGNEYKDKLREPMRIQIPLDGVETTVIDNSPLNPGTCNNQS